MEEKIKQDQKPTEDNNLIDALNRAKAELSILFEISNAMHTALQLDEMLYIILTGVTAHIGLGFNRAMLFLFNQSTARIEGKMGIGPDTADQADNIWKHVDAERMTLKDLIDSFSAERLEQSRFNSLVRSIAISSDKQTGGLLAAALNDGISLHITEGKHQFFNNDPFLKLFRSEEFAIVPLRTRDVIIGLIVADNFVTRKPITNDDIRMLSMFANQAGFAVEKSRLYEKMLVRAHTDSLTGLWNHGYFQQILDSRLTEAKAESEYLSLIMIDIDDFKIFNDTWGHQKGDEILIQIAQLLKDASRKLDYVCRYGGEEFVILLPKTNFNEAMAIAERIHAAVRKFHFEPDKNHPPQQITVSVGVATFPTHAHTKLDLIKIADMRLYEAKQKGKNRIIGVA